MPTTDTIGRQKLARLVELPDWSQSFIARQFDIFQASVSEWVSGQSRPRERFRALLQTLTTGAEEEIAASDWLTDDERATQARVDAVVAQRAKAS